ncbi:DnAJ-like protein [Quillaja saponaria]|uniref:DnAJ-like protein n=1 Tax=Quillaja saponaria TaxID=32244 RepID=A0AAD7PHQ0_QUISA|nr:DnAJ-like protein [Quillaja saponaria]
MACNKDEAIKAKEIAENKFTDMDMSGAKRFALKAQDLYPGLDGLSQFLETLDVYISAEKRINGEVDWYKVLDVELSANVDTIRRHYRKLALILHLDKNKSVGADGAFSFLSQAWSLLSDKSKRIAYDQNGNLRSIHEEVREQKPSAAAQNGVHDLFNTNNSKIKIRGVLLIPFLLQLLLYNRNLHFGQSFVALEVPPPPINKTAGNSRISQMQQKKSSPRRMGSHSYAPGRRPNSSVNTSENNFHSAAFSMSGDTSSVPVSEPSTVQAAGVVREASEHLKKELEGLGPPAMREEAHLEQNHASQKTVAGLATKSLNTGSSFVLKGDRRRKKMRIHEGGMANDRRKTEKEMKSGNGGVCLGHKYESLKENSDTGRLNAAENYKRNGKRDLSQAQIRNILCGKARKEVLEKLDEWNVASAARNLHKSNITNEEVKEKDQGRMKDSGNSVKACAQNFQEFVDSNTTFAIKKSYPTISDADSSMELADPVPMSVPDPDFHDFDMDRTEKTFGVLDDYNEERGQEGNNAPKGCWELDPAATPKELLQIFTEAQEEELVASLVTDDFVKNCQTIKKEDLGEDTARMVLAEAMVTESREEKLVVYKRKRSREKKML